MEEDNVKEGTWLYYPAHVGAPLIDSHCRKLQGYSSSTWQCPMQDCTIAHLEICCCATGWTTAYTAAVKPLDDRGILLVTSAGRRQAAVCDVTLSLVLCLGRLGKGARLSSAHAVPVPNQDTGSLTACSSAVRAVQAMRRWTWTTCCPWDTTTAHAWCRWARHVENQWENLNGDHGGASPGLVENVDEAISFNLSK